MNELIITLIKKHLLDTTKYSSNQLPEKCNGRDINVIWLCIEGKTCNGFQNIQHSSIEHKHFIAKIKEFIAGYSETDEIIMRKRTVFLKLLEEFPFTEEEKDDIIVLARQLDNCHEFVCEIVDRLMK